MDHTKSGNGDYNHFAPNYKGQNRMFLPFQDSSFNDPNAADRYTTNDPNFLNPAMGYANPMGMAESVGGVSLENMMPPNEQNVNYYQEYCRLFIANVVLTTQMKELIAEKNELITRLSELERGERITREPSTSDVGGTDKKPRLRRKAAEIERHYQCPVDTCQKNYGSEGSLIQHVKLKHPEITDDPDWKMKILNKSEAEENNSKE